MKYQQLRKKTEGFTIIEVLIVLAIAGLILLIVFLAVPSLQRNQRNNARNNDAARVSSSVTECLANRNGITTSCDTLTLDANFCATAGSEIQAGCLSQLTAGLGAAPNTTTLQLQFGTTAGGCNASGTGTAAGGSARAFSVLYQLEPAVTRCIES
jgi:prepilin-type N-terminal cleavage/methylation domain-containing protein